MKTHIEYGLQGAFKFEIFESGKIIESSDWVSNFITETGVTYPSIYAFADCFRYLSIGTSDQRSCGANVSRDYLQSTTGLYTPAPPLVGTVSNTPLQYIDWRGYYVSSPTNNNSACGTNLFDTGPSMFRAWVIPTGDTSNVVKTEPISIYNEFMVSPGKASDPTGRWAFSRITKSLAIKVGQKLIISYQLKISLNTTGSIFGKGTFNTGNAEVEGAENLELVSGWHNLTGFYRQVYHGLACVDQMGASFIPKYGAVMEPSCSDLSNTVFYLSPDNSQFDVNFKKGGTQTNVASAYLSDGLMQQVMGVPMILDGTFSTNGELSSEYGSKNDDQKETHYSTLALNRNRASSPIDDKSVPSCIRLGNRTNQEFVPVNVNKYIVPPTVDQTFNYQETQDSSLYDISYASRGLPPDETKADFKQKAVFSTVVYNMKASGMGALGDTNGRKWQRTRRASFAPISSLGTNTRFGSLVYGFDYDPSTTIPNRKIYPMVDCLFGNSSGDLLMQHYRIIRPYVIERGSGVAYAKIKVANFGGVYGENTKQYNDQETFQGSIPTDFNAFAQDRYDDISSKLVLIGDDVANKNTPGSVYNYGSNGNGWAHFSGWGGVIGVIGKDWAGKLPDCGLVDHNISDHSQPSPSSPLYWPTARGIGKKLMDKSATNNNLVDISTVKYYDPSWADGLALQTGDGSYDWPNNPLKFCPPHIVFRHYENWGTTGYRLLPQHTDANNTANTSPSNTGYYPGLSLDNGLDVYLTISWAAPCPTTVDNCTE